MVGRVAPPRRSNWHEAILVPADRALILCEFVELAARALTLPAAEVEVHQQLWAPGHEGASMHEGRWHCDAAFDIGHVVCIVGDFPTEFLLGVYPDAYGEGDRDLGELSDCLELWRPEPGQLVHIDRRTIHRRPPGRPLARMFMLGAKARPPDRAPS